MKTENFRKFNTLFTVRFLFLGLAICFSSLLFAQQKTPYYVKTIDSKNIREAELSTSGGSIQVINEPGESSRLEVYIQSNNGKEIPKDEIEKRLKEKYEFVIEASDNKIKAIAKMKSNFTDWKNALSISYKLYVPSKINTNLKTSGGSITLKGLDGKHDFKTSGGSLTISGTKGEILGKTSGGSIKISGSEGTIDLKTSGGSITASESKGQIDLSTSGGSLKLDNLQGKVHARTSGGSVSGQSIDGELITSTSGGSVRIGNISGSLDASTSGGSMDVSVTKYGEYVKLRNSGGGISLQLPAGKGAELDLRGTRVSVPGMTNFSGNASDDEIRGTINGGGVPVTVKSSAGRVSLTFSN